MAKKPNFTTRLAYAKAFYDAANAGATTMGNYAAISSLSGMRSNVLRTNAKMALAQAEQQKAYLNEELFYQNQNTAENALQLLGMQNASMGASGFDISTGDQRIIADTYKRMQDKIEGANRTAYLQSFENEKQAYLEALRLEYAAKAQDALKKRSSFGRGLLAGSFNALGAFAGNIGNLAAAGAFGSVSNNNITPTMSADTSWMKGINTSTKLDLNITPSYGSFLNF